MQTATIPETDTERLARLHGELERWERQTGRHASTNATRVRREIVKLAAKIAEDGR